MRVDFARGWRALALSAIVLVTAIGCGSGKPDLNLVPVTGTVTLDGKPIEGALIQFYDVANKNNPCAGTSDVDGKFAMGFSTYQGAAPGTYKVVVTYFTDPQGQPLPEVEGKDATMLVMEGKAKQALHPNYSDFNQSTLKQDIKEGEENEIDLALKSDGT